MDGIVALGIAKADSTKYRPRANTIVWLGDSITASGGRQTISPSYNSNGFWCWGQFFMGHPFQTLNNAGFAGDRTDQMLSRIQSDVLSYNPGWCHVLAGTNDVGQAIPISTIKNNLSQIWSLLDARGIRVIAGTIPPRNSYTGTMDADTHNLNAWIRGQGRARPNLIVVDYYAAVTDPSNRNYASTGVAGQNLTTDGVHPGNGAAPRMGKALANALSGIVPKNTSLSSSEGDAANVLPYSCFTQGAVGSNTPPTGWTQSALTGTIVYSRVARSDNILGNWLQLVMPSGSKFLFGNPNALISVGKFSIGDTVVGTVEINRSSIDQAAALSTSGVSLQIVAVGAGVASPSDLLWASGAYDNQALWNHSGIMRTPPFVVPAGTTALNLQLTLGGGQTVQLGRAGIFNITTSGLPA